MPTGLRQRPWRSYPGIDLSGRNAIVTGGASGIGVETVRALAAAGARVIVAARDLPAVEPAVAALRRDLAGASIQTRVLDLASLKSVRRFAGEYLLDHRQLDILISNAGIMATPYARTQDGFELQFGTSHLGHFALTARLLPALIGRTRSPHSLALLQRPPDS